MTERDKTFWVAVAVALVIGAVIGVAGGVGVAAIFGVDAEDPVARSVDAGCYRDLGGDKWICQSGGEMEFQSGSTLDIQSGATTGFGAAMDFDSTLNVDGAVTFNSTLDVDGNISSGTGAITMTDAVNITSTLDVDSTLNADGAVTLNSTLDVDGNISSGTGAVTVTDAVNITSTLDVDSTLNADGAVTLNSTLDVDGNISSGTGAVTVTDAVNITSTLDVDGAITFNSDELYPIGFDGSTQYEQYWGSANSVTQTTVTSATHNMTTAVDWAVCWVSDPDDDAGDPFLCVATFSGSSVVLQAVQDDGDNATTAATKLYYLLIGR